MAKQANASPPVCFECRFECIIFSSSVFVACHSLANGNNHLQVRASFGDPDGNCFLGIQASMFVFIHLPVASGSWGRESCLFSLEYRMAVVVLLAHLVDAKILAVVKLKFAV